MTKTTTFGQYLNFLIGLGAIASFQDEGGMGQCCNALSLPPHKRHHGPSIITIHLVVVSSSIGKRQKNDHKKGKIAIQDTVSAVKVWGAVLVRCAAVGGVGGRVV